jgi:hypothetical protein
MTEQLGLGRLVSKDDRDRGFMLAPKRAPTFKSYQYWTAKPALDQGSTPQCVGYSSYQWLTAFPVKNVPPFTPSDIYREAQLIDEWPGEDYDGTSVRAAFKILKAKGYVAEYRWAYDVETIVNHLLTVGPVVMGTVWTDGMFMADDEGYIDDVGGREVGGHAYVLIGANRNRKSERHGVGAVRVLNSWGTNWEDKGRAWLSFKGLEWLLAQDGEACAANEIKLNI